MNLEEICRVYGKQLPDAVPDHFKKMMNLVVPHVSGSAVPWDKVLPKNVYAQIEAHEQAETKRILDEIGPDMDYYKSIYTKTKSVFDHLQPAKVNFVKHKMYSIQEDASAHLSNWNADKYGFLPVPKYVLDETVTGRMKIKSGPNILLLPKKYRDILTSRFGSNGSIWYLDFTSLEPRVALSVKSYIDNHSLIGSVPLIKLLDLRTDDPLPKDVYSLALKTLKLSSEVSRDDIKQIVLSQLYGQSKSHTIEALEKHKVRDPEEVVDMVNDFFGIDALRQFVVQGFLKTDSRHLRTFYGRHLTPEDGKPHALLNYYVQSTAVDVALLGFAKILDRLAQIPDSLKVLVPIFLLHDALILDVHKDVEHLIPKLCTLGSKDIPGFGNQIFYMSGNKL